MYSSGFFYGVFSSTFIIYRFTTPLLGANFISNSSCYDEPLITSNQIPKTGLQIKGKLISY